MKRVSDATAHMATPSRARIFSITRFSGAASMKFSTRKRIAAGLSLIVFLPFLPFAAVSVAARALHDLIEWAFDGRLLARQANTFIEAIERALRVDPDSERAEWQARRAATKIITEKQ
jgi:hypothetical protein